MKSIFHYSTVATFRTAPLLARQPLSIAMLALVVVVNVLCLYKIPNIPLYLLIDHFDHTKSRQAERNIHKASFGGFAIRKWKVEDINQEYHR